MFILFTYFKLILTLLAQYLNVCWKCRDALDSCMDWWDLRSTLRHHCPVEAAAALCNFNYDKFLNVIFGKQ